MNECPTCSGSGEICWEPMDWWHGSGVNVQSSSCPTCSGTGEVEPEPSDEDEPDEQTDETMTDDEKHRDLQALLDWQTAEITDLGLVVG